MLIKHNPSFISRLTIERVVTEHVPSEDLQGAYSIVPAPGGELRHKLLAMTVTGNRTAVATHCLHLIDEIRHFLNHLDHNSNGSLKGEFLRENREF